MAEVEIEIGGRTFEVACQDGEEHFLMTAAAMLDAEAKALTSQIGRMPESRMLLMAGLMLADRTASLDDRVRDADARVADMAARLDEAQGRAAPPPERVEVPVVPRAVTDTLAELAARAEALAAEIEEKSD